MVEGVWIIEAFEGEYDDYTNWIDSVHPTKKSANERLKTELKATLAGSPDDDTDRWFAGKTTYDVQAWAVDGKPKDN
jgi:hypothetical protein